MSDAAFHVRHPPCIYQHHVNIYCLKKKNIRCVQNLYTLHMSLNSCVHNSYRVLWSVLLLDKSQMLSLIYHVSRVIRASCHNIMKCMIKHENNRYLYIYIYIYLQRFMPEVLFINCGGVNERPRCEWRCAIAPLIFLKAPPLFVRFVGPHITSPHTRYVGRF